ncbi:hypothetical protein J2755_000003 [Methanohalophilus levihalophilus]|uniref:DUF7544 domain-containing protein n=1 Tax=Methanohalophilus levihalophilus TaxID=1431282 RepID=UPI001AEAA42C|nr:hypothetical protein [Methanohalophilus levihalophilus]MBP2029083.1 hypothetical protein [Methanohalophilus levihalophilus]
MSWYVADALDGAYRRTKSCLLEPFDFWKWMKLAIIVMLIGGSGSNFNSGGDIFSSDYSDSGTSDEFNVLFEEIFEFFSDPNLVLILTIVFFILILILFFSYVSSVMDFVFVDSLVSNDVRFWEYTRKYLGKGLGLFGFRILITIIFLALIALVSLPVILLLIESSANGFSDFTFAGYFASIMLALAGIIVLSIVGAMVDSFVNLAIPVALYRESGIISAFSDVFRQFRKDWKQIVVYWFGRILLGLGVGIAFGILLLIVMLAVGLVFAIMDVMIYFALSALIPGSDTLIWIILGPIIAIQFIILILVLALVGMPASVFMKYHMLTFLQQWYPEVEIPVFDMQEITEKEMLISEE